MVRTIHSSAKTIVQSDQVSAVMMAHLDFGSDGNVYVNSSGQNITFSGNSYLGVGGMGGISGVQESTELASYAVNLQLSGIASTNLSLALNSNYQNKLAIIYMAIVNDDDAIVGSPIIMFQGRMDAMNIEMGETATISVRVVSRLSDWERNRGGRYTNEDQQEKHPEVVDGSGSVTTNVDKGLEMVAQATEKVIYWGRRTPK